MMAYLQFRIREEDRYKTSFRVPGGQYEFLRVVGAFGLQGHGMSSLLMRVMHSIFGRDTLSTGRARPAVGPPGSGAPMLGWFVQVYCDDILIFSKTREEHPVHVRMVLETLGTTSCTLRPRSASSAAPPSPSLAESSPSAASRSTLDAGRSTDIRIECYADACLCGLSRGRGGQQLCIFMARVYRSRDNLNNRFVSHGFRVCHRRKVNCHGFGPCSGVSSESTLHNLSDG